MIKIDLKRHRKEIIGSVVVLLILLGGMSVFKYTSFNSGFEIVDDLGGNIFPSAILSVATTDAQVIVPSDSTSLGNPKSCIAVRLKSKTAYSRVRIEVAETPFFSRSVSEFVLNKPRTEYTIYPDIIWNYEALKNEVQAEPVSVAITVEMNGKDLGQRVRTFSVRSINECLLGYVANGTKFHDTSIFFAAYVNEENPMIDQLLREALNTRIVNRFLGYQSKAKGAVDKQVYALWNILQKRKFRYSSVSNTSLSSNVVFSQRVRTFDDALESLELKDGYLTISAAKGLDKDEKDKEGKYIRRERYAGNMSRSFYVGKDITEKDIHGKYENGILMLDIPKKAPEKKVEEKKFVTIEG